MQNPQDGLKRAIEMLKSMPQSSFLNRFVITQYRSLGDDPTLASSEVRSFVLSILEVFQIPFVDCRIT